MEGNKLNHLRRGHFFTRRHQKSELAGWDLQLDARPRPGCSSLGCSRKMPSVDAATSLHRGSALSGGQKCPPTSEPHALPHPRRGSARRRDAQLYGQGDVVPRMGNSKVAQKPSVPALSTS